LVYIYFQMTRTKHRIIPLRGDVRSDCDIIKMVILDGILHRLISISHPDAGASVGSWKPADGTPTYIKLSYWEKEPSQYFQSRPDTG